MALILSSVTSATGFFFKGDKDLSIDNWTFKVFYQG